MNRNLLRNPATRTARQLPATAKIRANLGSDLPRAATDEDYPLIEIVTDPMLSGFWLYLHPTPDGATEQPRFHAAGDEHTLKNVCAMMIASHITRTTPPTTPEPGRNPIVFTASDFLAR